MGEVKFWDLLYRAYASPMDLITQSIRHGRFGAFVEGFLRAETERRQAEAERENDWMLWVAYVHSYTDKSFDDWKREVLRPATTGAGHGKDYDMTDDDVKNIVGRLFPSHTIPGK